MASFLLCDQISSVSLGVCMHDYMSLYMCSSSCDLCQPG